MWPAVKAVREAGRGLNDLASGASRHRGRPYPPPFPPQRRSLPLIAHDRIAFYSAPMSIREAFRALHVVSHQAICLVPTGTLPQ